MRSFPRGIRCAPLKKPLSDVNISRVFASSRFAASAWTIFLTPSSTDSSDSSWQRYLRWMSAIWLGVQARAAPDRGRLVGDVALVEVRGLRQRLGVEGMGVARRRRRGAATVLRRVRVRKTAPVRGRVGEPEEERLRLRRPAVDEVHRLSGQHVLLEVGGPGTRRGPRCRSRSACSGRRPGRSDRRVPLRPARRHKRALVVAVQVLADQGGVVARVLQPDGEVVVSVQGLEPGKPPSGGALSTTPWLCAYWPVRKVARDGQQSE